MGLGKSLEDYIRAIYILKQCYGNVRCVMVARFLGNSRPSVTKGVQKLEKAGYLYKDRAYLCLTLEGEEIARKLCEKYEYYLFILLAAGVSRELAEEEAHRMEHVLCEDSYQKLRAYLDRILDAASFVSDA